MFQLAFGFYLGWWARTSKQRRIEGEAFYEQYERPCEHVHEQWGACQGTGFHLFHTRGQMGWSGGWSNSR